MKIYMDSRTNRDGDTVLWNLGDSMYQIEYVKTRVYFSFESDSPDEALELFHEELI